MKFITVLLTNERCLATDEELKVTFRFRDAHLARRFIFYEPCKRPEYSLSEVQNGSNRPIVQWVVQELLNRSSQERDESLRLYCHTCFFTISISPIHLLALPK
jgi:hypothetical protein